MIDDKEFKDVIKFVKMLSKDLVSQLRMIFKTQASVAELEKKITRLESKIKKLEKNLINH